MLFFLGGQNCNTSWQVTESFEDNFYWCENLALNQINPAARSSFTFVREPLARFVSGYAEIDRRLEELETLGKPGEDVFFFSPIVGSLRKSCPGFFG